MKITYEKRTDPEVGAYHYFTTKLRDGKDYYIAVVASGLSLRRLRTHVKKVFATKEAAL